MAFEAKILADTINPENSRLTTMVLTYPRCIHSEFMTHRMFSRNAASSRAIPIAKMMKDVKEKPFIPLVWGSNKKGMQAGEQIDYPETAKMHWLMGRDAALQYAKNLNGMNIHKQIVNRILEPWMWITVIATADNRGWENFFHLRCDEMAEPHIQKIAYMARDLYDNRSPRQITLREGIVKTRLPDFGKSPQLDPGDWHLPLVGFEGDEKLSTQDLIKVSVGRCARVSYLTHEGKRDVQADIDLHDRLKESGHWSPFEHVAQVNGDPECNQYHGNFHWSWKQYRKTFKTECCVKAERVPQ